MIRIKQIRNDIKTEEIISAMNSYGNVLRILRKNDSPGTANDAYVVFTPTDPKAYRLKRIVCLF